MAISRFMAATGVAALMLSACSQGGETEATGTADPTPAAVAPAGGAAAGGALAAGDLPRPRAGLWRVTTRVETPQGEMALPPNEICHTEESLKAPELPEGAGQGDCSQEAFRRDGNGFRGNVTCKMDGTTAQYSFRMTGDFTRTYETEIISRMSPAPAPGLEQSRIRMSAEYLGPCPAE